MASISSFTVNEQHGLVVYFVRRRPTYGLVTIQPVSRMLSAWWSSRRLE